MLGWLPALMDWFMITDAKNPHDLLEVKNPFSVQDKELDEACKSSGICLQKKDGMYKLKVSHDYYFQVQCQLYCANRSWCDFVLRTNKHIHIERIQRDKSWWEQHLEEKQRSSFSLLFYQSWHVQCTEKEGSESLSLTVIRETSLLVFELLILIFFTILFNTPFFIILFNTPFFIILFNTPFFYSILQLV